MVKKEKSDEASRKRAKELADGLKASLPERFTMAGRVVDGEVISPDLVFEAHPTIPGRFTAKADHRYISGDFKSNANGNSNGNGNGNGTKNK